MGGGGGSSRDLEPSELANLEQVAKKSLKGGSEEVKRNVFLSFPMENQKEVNLLRAQSKKEDSELEFNDYSIKEPFDSKNAEYIKRGIREQIRQCSVTVVYLSEDSAKSSWVNWEIEESVALGKGVVGMYQGDKPPANVPQAIKRHKIRPVPWNHEELSKAIEKAAKKRTGK